MYRLRRWFSWKEWRYQLRYRAWGMIQRSRRGWADHDVWNMDTYLAAVIAEMLRRLATNTHSWPGPVPGEKNNPFFIIEDWQIWLKEKAEWFDWYAAAEMDWNSSKTDEENKKLMDAYMAKHKEFQEKVLPDFAKWFSALWD